MTSLQDADAVKEEESFIHFGVVFFFRELTVHVRGQGGVTGWSQSENLDRTSSSFLVSFCPPENTTQVVKGQFHRVSTSIDLKAN